MSGNKIEMMDDKLDVRPKRYRGESTVTSLRLPKEMIHEIDGIAEKTGYSRNELIMTFLEFAIKNTVIKNE